MAASTHTELPLETPQKRLPAPPALVHSRRKAGPASSANVGTVARYPEEGSFRTSMLEYNRMKSGKKWVNLLISLSINCTVLIIPIFLALCFTDTLDLRQFASTFLVAPPPPPPPPPPAVKIVNVAPAHRVFESSGKLMAPRAIPREIAMIKESPMPPEVDGAGVEGGVPGGVSGGSMGGVIGGVIGGVTSAAVAAPLAPKREAPKAPVRVGGRVKEPKLLSRVEALYPLLAKQTHQQGSVVIEAIIDEHGEVTEMKIVSGPPLLIQSAMDAVRRWRYEPTYLNDEPVPVQLNVTVIFQLHD